MSGLKRTVVASDLSPRADEALARAAQLATAHGATALTVLHILETPSLKERVAQQAAAEAEETLRQKIATLSLPRGIAVTAHAVTGRATASRISRVTRRISRGLRVGTITRSSYRSLKSQVSRSNSKSLSDLTLEP